MISGGDMQAHIGAMLDGTLSDDATLEALRALSDVPLSAPLIEAAADAVMQRATGFDASKDVMDVCGTGGDGTHSVNISTAVAFVVAACGMPVVKHGNRAVSSSSGSADVLTALGMPATLSPDFWRSCFEEHGIAFLFAPHFHPGLVRLAPLRKALGVRTVFNVLGPLCNPARPERQLMGVYARSLVPVIADVLRARGSTRAWVVHGEAGEDEMSLCGSTHVAKLFKTNIVEQTHTPEEAGLVRHAPNALRGGTAAENAKAMIAMFEGAQPAYRDAVVLNAAAALVVAEKAANLATGAALAHETIANGRALRLLKALQAMAEKAGAHA